MRIQLPLFHRKRWEYHVRYTPNDGVPMIGDGPNSRRMERGLNTLGEEGWMLCAAPGSFLIFRRPARSWWRRPLW